MAYLNDDLIKRALLDGNGMLTPASEELLWKLAGHGGLSLDEFGKMLKEKEVYFYTQDDFLQAIELQKCNNCGSSIPLLSKIGRSILR